MEKLAGMLDGIADGDAGIDAELTMEVRLFAAGGEGDDEA